MNRRQSIGLIAFFSLAACQTTDKTGLLGTFRIGERAPVGSLIYNVYETQYSLKIGDGPDARIPKQRFFIVHLTAVNSGAARVDQAIPTFTLVDDAGTSFSELEDGAGIPQWLGMARKVRPAESISGNIVFDVAPKHYKLKIADDTDQHFLFVDLPLTFGDPNGPMGGAPPAPEPPATSLPR